MEYKQSAIEAEKIFFNFLTKRRKEKGITQVQLAELLEISETTLIRYFKQETQMPLDIHFMILGILEINPYFIPKEIDQIPKEYIFFN